MGYDVNNPPPGGFKQSGWYWDPNVSQARQYWGGSFGAPTTVANPNQSGFGERVSTEVQAQSGFVAQEPKSSEEVSPYLNNFQSSMFAAANRPQRKVQTMEELKTELLPKTGAPEPLNRVSKFEELRVDQGVETLEKSLTDLKAQEEGVYATLRQRKAGEEGKPVATGVISGRVSEIEKQERENLDFVQRQINRVSNELNTKYSVISTYMNYYGLDYQDSVTRYNNEFDQNLKMYQIITGRQDAEMEAWEKDRAAASSNLTLMMNALTSGNMDYSSMSADQKVQVAKLEAQAGIPIGTMASVKIDPKANIVFQTENDGIVQIGIRNADGTISVQRYGTKISGGKTGSLEQAKQETINFPDLLVKYANTLSLEDIYKAYGQSSFGEQYGKPKEDPFEIKLLYKVAKGEMTAKEAERELRGK